MTHPCNALVLFFRAKSPQGFVGQGRLISKQLQGRASRAGFFYQGSPVDAVFACFGVLRDWDLLRCAGSQVGAIERN